ncbi:hypothetical protein PLESTB_001785600 [Pleodorina starrii]|uniref:Uncharacterized protein n=1 Tax=Pleodorina starrii TaxID=330485 RepID=A0A9W6C0R5_9CHLO|nr:hypothetical protein PLESTM_001756400 [Pleodorina starrii]GLC61638.1 hypothetical protein PLESTB_001785600 [Pleodorina starrii]
MRRGNQRLPTTKLRSCQSDNMWVGGWVGGWVDDAAMRRTPVANSPPNSPIRAPSLPSPPFVCHALRCCTLPSSVHRPVKSCTRRLNVASTSLETSLRFVVSFLQSPLAANKP